VGQEQTRQKHNFGPWAYPDAALKKYLDQRDALHAGLEPRACSGEGLTVRNLASRFLTGKKVLLDAGEEAPTQSTGGCCEPDSRVEVSGPAGLLGTIIVSSL
jgi:hypothetical protein